MEQQLKLRRQVHVCKDRGASVKAETQRLRTAVSATQEDLTLETDPGNLAVAPRSRCRVYDVLVQHVFRSSTAARLRPTGSANRVGSLVSESNRTPRVAYVMRFDAVVERLRSRPDRLGSLRR